MLLAIKHHAVLEIQRRMNRRVLALMGLTVQSCVQHGAVCDN